MGGEKKLMQVHSFMLRQVKDFSFVFFWIIFFFSFSCHAPSLFNDDSNKEGEKTEYIHIYIYIFKCHQKFS